MRGKRIITCAVLGGLLGFGGQFVADFFCWNSPNDDETMYHDFSDPNFEKKLAECLPTPPQSRYQVHSLLYLGCFLFWLRKEAI
jgi:hypothetical protein